MLPRSLNVGIINTTRIYLPLRRVARIHRERRAGDVARLLREQEFHGRSNVRGLRQPAQRAAPDDLLALLRIELARHLGVDESRRDRVHRDPELAELPRE